MKVAWDLQAITGPRPTGLGLAVRFLLEAVRRHAPETEALELRPNTRDAALSSVPDRLAWEQVRLPLALRKSRRAGAQLAFTPALGAPLLSPFPQAAYVHDLIPLKQPEHFSGPARWYWSTLLPATWRRCQALAVSNHTVADELAELLRYPRARIRLVPYYIDPTLRDTAAELRASGEVPARDEASTLGNASPGALFLTVGSHEPRKNLELAIRALAHYNEAQPPARLAITGVENAHTQALRQLAAELGVTERVDFTGYLDRRQLAARLLAATALVFASREEGFGLPPLEAQSVGCPVVLSDTPVLRAVHADPARLAQLAPELRSPPACVPVDDASALAAELARLATDADYRARQVQAGLAYSATFTPQATASALVDLFHTALE
jgi:glycosyltransferase involved in cell wall biosynthesis